MPATRKLYTPPEKAIKNLFRQAMDEQGLQYADLAKKTKQTECAIQKQFSRGKWPVRRIRQYATILNIRDAEAIGKAIIG